MGYRGRHRKPPRRAKARAVTLALAVSSISLVVPVATTSGARANTLLSVEGLPAWAFASDIIVNPPGPKPGEAVAPAVSRGYVITGDHLARFNVTATREGQQELAAFVARIKDNYGLSLDAKA